MKLLGIACSYTVRLCILSLLLALVLFTLVLRSAHAAPHAQSPEECSVLADVALVAATHAKHGIGEERTLAMLPDMYGGLDARGLEIAHSVVAAARSFFESTKGKPSEFASALADTCMQRRGNLDAILGVRL